MKNLMKIHCSKVLVPLLFVFTWLSAQAGEVTSTFSAGGTLTATQMTEIKDAVNDNNAGVDANTTAIGTNATDISANTTAINANTAAFGSTLNVSGGSFLPAFSADSTEWHRYDLGGNYGFPTTENFTYATAGVSMPDGAVLSAMRCYFLDNNGTHDLTSFGFTLYFTPVAGFSTFSAASASGTATTGSSPTAIVVEDTTITHTVDNSSNRYWIRVFMDASAGYTATTSSSIALGGCSIDYTI